MYQDLGLMIVVVMLLLLMMWSLFVTTSGSK
jgi:hypothetical protein